MDSRHTKNCFNHETKDSGAVKARRQEPSLNTKCHNHGPKDGPSTDSDSLHRASDKDLICEGLMSNVVNCVRKIIYKVLPIQAASVFGWIVVTAAFICVLVSTTYFVTRHLSQPDERTIVPKPIAMHTVEQQPLATLMHGINVTTREFCSTLSKDLYLLEQMGYMDPEHRVSKLMALNISSSDVHYVFTNSTHVPWLYTCSLESALRSVTGNYRINVFVVYGMQFEESQPEKYRLLSLSASLTDLLDMYGEGRLRVEHVNLEECLECSPFQGMDLSRRPTLAEFVVQLVLLWQFGGTVLDAGLVAVRRELYRTADDGIGGAVEYGDRTISSPVACHPFVYDMMLFAKSFALRDRPFSAETSRRIVNKTVARTNRSDGTKDARPMADGIVCRGGVVGGHCYYVEVDASVTTTEDNANFYVHGFCPVVSETTSPRIGKRVTGNNNRKH